ncbi:hypothetical protein CRG98_026366, partial [Punica granatum]
MAPLTCLRKFHWLSLSTWQPINAVLCNSRPETFEKTSPSPLPRSRVKTTRSLPIMEAHQAPPPTSSEISAKPIVSLSLSLSLPARQSDRTPSSGAFALDRTVAPSGPPSLTRRKSAPAAAGSKSSSSAPTRVIYREAKQASGSGYPFWQQTWFIGLLFLMAIGFFALAVFLFFGLDLEQGSPSPSHAAASEGVE